jgi:hypothetical protein
MIFEKKLLDTKYVFWFSLLLSEIIFILKRIQQDIVINAHMSSWKVHIILLRFLRFKWTLNIFEIFSKNSQILNFMKIRHVEAEWSNADRRIWRKLTFHFRNYANPHKNLMKQRNMYLLFVFVKCSTCKLSCAIMKFCIYKMYKLQQYNTQSTHVP